MRRRCGQKPAYRGRLKVPRIQKLPADNSQADAYYYFTIGHLQEQQYEITNNADSVNEAVDNYKKALDLNPGSATIMERLAEVYAKSQRVREAVVEAQQVLKMDPDNVAARRLLARIYVRTLGDTSGGAIQQETIDKAVGQFEAILKIEPDDTFSALWLARLYRFENRHDEAEKILRGILNFDVDNGPALEQLSQILVDEGRSQDAIDLLTKAALDSASPDIYDLLGDAYSQKKDYANAEAAYQRPWMPIRMIRDTGTALRRRFFPRTNTLRRSNNIRSFRSLSLERPKTICGWLS